MAAMEGEPNYWAVYFAVEDSRAAEAKAKSLGAKSIMPPSETPVGEIAVVADPQGAVFSLFKPSPTQQ
jgi:predicted enzyme related to lactoylglutathione lyase